MGDVQRIMYVHVPTAWNAMLAFTFAFGCALVFLLNGDLEVGLAHGGGDRGRGRARGLLCLQGAIWAKPTWGVWWDWDPRLTTTAVMVFAFAGILALRNFVEDPVRRGTWSAVATIIAFVDVPIVYFSVRWWNSLHQLQSTPETVSPAVPLAARINAFGILFLMAGLMMLRTRTAPCACGQELAPPPPEPSAAATAPGGRAMNPTGVIRAAGSSSPRPTACRLRYAGSFTVVARLRYRAAPRGRARREEVVMSDRPAHTPSFPHGTQRWFALSPSRWPAAAFAVITAGGIGDNLVYYWGPTD
jgi:heme exporter protein C